MSLSEPDVDWSFAPEVDKAIDIKVSFGMERGNGWEWFMHQAIIMICVEEADCYQGVYTTPSFYEPWEVEIIIVRPVMKCWGRGLSLKRGAKHA